MRHGEDYRPPLYRTVNVPPKPDDRYEMIRKIVDDMSDMWWGTGKSWVDAGPHMQQALKDIRVIVTT